MDLELILSIKDTMIMVLIPTICALLIGIPLLVESRSSLVLGLTSSIISFISYSTVMGIVGGGGIGDYAMRYGYYEYNYELVYKVVLIMIFIVFVIQFLGTYISNKLNKKRRDF